MGLSLIRGKCHRLITGFRNARICQFCDSQARLLMFFGCIKWNFVFCSMQDWWRTSLTAQWRGHRPGGWPSNLDSPAKIHIVAGLGPTDGPPDQMHTWHLGVGQDVVASTVVPWKKHGQKRTNRFQFMNVWCCVLA